MHRRLYLSILLLFLLPMYPAAAETPPPRITVTGEGTAEAAPDMATLDLTVTREGDTARSALDANNAAMARVLAAMREEGIAQRDLQTSNFAIQPRYHHPPKKASGERPPPEIIGYIVRNSLSVRVRDLDRLGAIIDKSVTLGVNEGGRIAFGNSEPDKFIEKARIAAVKDAMARADTLANAAGVKRGSILEISEQSFRPRPMPMMQAEMAMARAADAVPIAAGESTYRVMVNMAFAIGD